MKHFLKQFISFIQKSYSKPVLIGLIMVLLIGIFIAYDTTQKQKSSAGQNYAKREQELTDEYNKEIQDYNRELGIYNSKIALKNLSDYEYYKKTGESKIWLGFSEPMPPITLENQKIIDSYLNNFRRIEKSPFLVLWKENLGNRTSFLILNSNIFEILIMLIILIPILRGLVLLALYGKKQILIISRMTAFQKYVIILAFCVLILLSLILIKVF
ncbi:MAG: hypothetical protein LiPW39_388 [Parcubacteria group bacterium LiPW_39]|nr:MAG: hypothetical protein LiPW39_388 [Parcubacteria group bacterium LiPW_39]